MQRCTTCGNEKFDRARRKVTVELRIRHEGRDRDLGVFAHVPSRRCTKCGTHFESAVDLERFELSAAERLMALGLRAGGILRFARKALGMRAVDLAELLDVTPETISHWENDRREIDLKALVVVRDLIRDRIEGGTRTADQLKALRAPRLPSEPMHVEL